MARYPQWVTEDKSEYIDFLLEPSSCSMDGIIQELEDFVQALKDAKDQFNVTGARVLIDENNSYDECYHYEVGSSMTITVEHAVPLTQKQIDANIKRYKKEREGIKAQKAKADELAKKKMTKLIKANKSVAKEILKEIETDG